MSTNTRLSRCGIVESTWLQIAGASFVILLVLNASSMAADPVTVVFSGTIASIDDPGGVLDPSVGIGTPVSGSYTIDTDDLAISFPNDPASTYYYFNNPTTNTMTATVGQFPLTVIPQRVGGVTYTAANIRIADEFPGNPFIPPSDWWLIGLLENPNLAYEGGATVPHSCFLQFVDPTFARLSSNALYVETSAVGWGQVRFACFDLVRFVFLFHAPVTVGPPLPACADGIDNDGDGLIDYGADLGCDGPNDESEKGTATAGGWLLVCDDGADNDGDGLIDYPDDPGCFSPAGYTENPACSDGLDNDTDGATDYPSDPECKRAWDTSEVDPGAQCGIGFELAFVLPPLMWLHRRRRA